MEKTATGEAREADEIDEEQPRVIAAGLTIWADSRASAVERVKMVVLDHDPDHNIETLRKFGMKVLAATRRVWICWNSPGCEGGRYWINAIDDPANQFCTEQLVKPHFALQITPRP